MTRFTRMRHHTATARRLRHAPTDAERLLWMRHRGKRLRTAFRRQHPLAGYILDFHAPTVRLAVELDGGQHAPGARRDAMRTRVLTARGVTVLRFWNNEVLDNPDGVESAILTVLSHLAARTPSLSLGPGERSTGPFASPAQALSGGGDRGRTAALETMRIDFSEPGA